MTKSENYRMKLAHFEISRQYNFSIQLSNAELILLWPDKTACKNQILGALLHAYGNETLNKVILTVCEASELIKLSNAKGPWTKESVIEKVRWYRHKLVAHKEESTAHPEFHSEAKSAMRDVKRVTSDIREAVQEMILIIESMGIESDNVQTVSTLAFTEAEIRRLIESASPLVLS